MPPNGEARPVTANGSVHVGVVGHGRLGFAQQQRKVAGVPVVPASSQTGKSAGGITESQVFFVYCGLVAITIGQRFERLFREMKWPVILIPRYFVVKKKIGGGLRSAADIEPLSKPSSKILKTPEFKLARGC